MQSPLPPMDGLIFDLDGTLADTLADIAAAINRTRVRFGIAPLPEPAITRHVGAGTEFLVRRTVPVGGERFAEAHRLYLEHYDAHPLDRTRPYEGAEAVLEHYWRRILGVISNKPIRQTERILSGLGWTDRFRVVLGGDSLPRKKPDPLPIQVFLERSGLDARRTVIIGDGPADIQAGKAAGVWTVAVTYGVGTREELEAEGPDRIVHRIAELPAIVR